ncbi:MAG: hypothetical protein Q9219_007465 [cf. Caloplaca sp. 3 TL-2023]
MSILRVINLILIAFQYSFPAKASALEAAHLYDRSRLTAVAKRATPQRQPTQLVAEKPQSNPTPRLWSTFDNGGPIDFKPFGAGNVMIRVTRRDNAATIVPSQIYDLNLDCLYSLFNVTVHSRTPVLPTKAVVCNPDILGIVISSLAEPLNDISVAAVDAAFESIQELTHHLSIQELDFELFNTTDAAKEPKLITTGCLAYQYCGHEAASVPSNLTLQVQSSYGAYAPPGWPNTTVNIRYIPQPNTSPIPHADFADVVVVFYRALLLRVLAITPDDGNLTMPVEPPFRQRPPLHRRQMWESNYYSFLRIAFAQPWNSELDFLLPDIAAVINFPFRKKLKSVELINGMRGYFEKSVKAYPFFSRRTGQFCLFYAGSGGAEPCENLFQLDPAHHPGGVPISE